MTLFHEADGIRLWHGDALKVSEFIEPASVDLIVTSPPYFALRSYTDGGEHYEGQIGSEATPREFVDALVACTAEWVKVLKPGGSIWVNLGDKYAGSGGHNNASLSRNGTSGSTLSGGRSKLRELNDMKVPATRRQSPDRYSQNSDGIRAKSLMLLPERYRIRCVDDLGLIARAVVIWSKPNGLPESVTDRVRRSHEDWVHLTKEPRYFAAVDEVREPHATEPGREGVGALAGQKLLRPVGPNSGAYSALGKIPGSVWTIPSEPLRIPADAGLEDHFAAFPTEWPRRIILGWSPSGVCVECGEGRRPTLETSSMEVRPSARRAAAMAAGAGGGRTLTSGTMTKAPERSITGYSCACPEPTAPTRPAVILDPFGGTGTTALVARALGRHAHHVDLSRGYLRTAQWRIWNDDHAFRKASERSGIKVPAAPVINGQIDLFGGEAA